MVNQNVTVQTMSGIASDFITIKSETITYRDIIILIEKSVVPFDKEKQSIIIRGKKIDNEDYIFKLFDISAGILICNKNTGTFSKNTK